MELGPSVILLAWEDITCFYQLTRKVFNETGLNHGTYVMHNAEYDSKYLADFNMGADN